MSAQEFDLIVIGGGPGGYVAAIRAAQLGLKTACIEREHLGGICLNWGCIPTKALLRSAEVFHLLHRLDEFGFSADNIAYDAKKVVKRSRDISKQLSQGVAHLLRKNKITVFDGEGKLVGDGQVVVALSKEGEKTLKSPHIILATGARARELPELKPDGDKVWSYKEAMVPEAVPTSILVVGSGAIGMEFASFYADMGSEVTVVEVLDRILPVEDEEISKFAYKAFEKRGIKIMTGAKIADLDKSGERVKATIEAKGGSTEFAVEKVISAVGIVGNVEGIGLEATQVQVDHTHIVIDKWCRTGEPGVYAVGDVVGPPWLAHKAMHEAVMCVEKIAGHGHPHPMDTTRIPSCTYCRPQVASVGLTEAAAKEKGYDVKVGKFPFIGNGKAIAQGDSEGLIKTIFDAKTGELLGAHMVGAEVTELIQGYTLARTLETTEAELMATVFPHPTLSEMMHEAVLDAYGQTLHF